MAPVRAQNIKAFERIVDAIKSSQEPDLCIGKEGTTKRTFIVGPATFNIELVRSSRYGRQSFYVDLNLVTWVLDKDAREVKRRIKIDGITDQRLSDFVKRVEEFIPAMVKRVEDRLASEDRSKQRKVNIDKERARVITALATKFPEGRMQGEYPTCTTFLVGDGRIITWRHGSDVSARASFKVVTEFCSLDALEKYLD